MMKNQYFDNPQYLAPLDDSKAEKDFTVLTDRESIRFFIKDICNVLRHPVTILDINRVEEEPNDKLRIDSDVEYFSLRSACRLFRHCSTPERCYECDEYHAKVFKEYLLDKKALPTSNYPHFFYDGYSQNGPKILQILNRDVLEYNCPILGYRELMFPIYFENSLIGILVLGQTMVKQEKDKEKVRQISKSFFGKSENLPENLFRDFCDYYNYIHGKNLSPNDVMEIVVTADQAMDNIDSILNTQRKEMIDTAKETKMTFDSVKAYEEFIAATCKEIEIFEKKICELFVRKKEEYFTSISEEIVLEFYQKCRKCSYAYQYDKFNQRKEELHNEWQFFYEAAQKVKEKFDLENIYLFGDGVSIKVIDNHVKPLYQMQDEKGQRLNWMYDFSKANEHIHATNDFISSLEFPDILDGLCKEMLHMKNHCIILVYSGIAVIIKAREVALHRSTYKLMTTAIGKNFSKICLSIALCRANLTKERHVLTLRMNRHESSHIASKLSDNMRRYFSQKGQTFLNLDKEKQELVVDDMYNTIRLISHMSQNVGIITGSENAATINKGKGKSLDVFDMLYKWQIMFRERLQDRNIDLVIVRSLDVYNERNKHIEPDAQRYILTNPDFFELLVYNLVDNAVKYAHRGSKIYLNWCHPDNGKSNAYRLTVSSLGPKIENDTNIYELYARGSKRDLLSVDGDGIGLYVVKRIEQFLGLKVSHKCSKISEYHLPLVSWYVEESFHDAHHRALQSKLQSYMKETEYNREKEWINDNEYTAIRRRDISAEYLNRRIEIGSWQTTFQVEVPT